MEAFDLSHVAIDMAKNVPLWVILGYFFVKHLDRLKKIESSLEEIKLEIASARLKELVHNVTQFHEFKSVAENEIASLWKAVNGLDKRRSH